MQQRARRAFVGAARGEKGNTRGSKVHTKSSTNVVLHRGQRRPLRHEENQERGDSRGRGKGVQGHGQARRAGEGGKENESTKFGGGGFNSC